MSNTAPSFSVGDGTVTTNFGYSDDTGRAVAIQTDGKILVAGYSNGNFALARYNADGSLDTSFGTGGIRGTTFGANTTDQGFSIALDGSGNILVAGSSANNFAVARYTSTGSLDATFGTGGLLTTDFGSTDSAMSLLVQPSGKIVVAGYAFNGAGNGYDFALARYDNSGALDTSFGTGGTGKVTTNFGGTVDDYGYSLTQDGSGRLLVAGKSGNDFALARYDSNGGLDTSFSGDGILTTDFASGVDVGQSVTVDGSGRILVAGYAAGGVNGNDFAVARYDDSGNLDTGFDGDGKVTTNLSDDYAYGIAVQTDGKIVVAGQRQDVFTGNDFALVRYNADGTLDTGFDGDGRVLTSIGTSDSAQSLLLQADGRIMVAGASGGDFAVARYLSNGGLDPSWDAVNTLNASPAYTQGSGNPTLLAGGSIQVYDPELYLLGNYGGASVTLARHGGASADDVFYNPYFSGTDVLNGATVVGTVTNGGGTLTITFNTNATQAVVDSVLSDITYANDAPTAPATVQLDWAFHDNAAVDPQTGTGISVVTINHAPSGTDNTLTVQEDQPRVFTAADFGFSDPDAGDSLGGVYFNTVPVTGSLSLHGVIVTDGTWVNLADLSHLKFIPAADVHGSSYASLSFSVTDQSGGADLTPNTLTFDVAAVNDAPLFIAAPGEGKLTTVMGDSVAALSMAIQDDGKILAAGDGYLVRYNADGTLDTGFDGDGRLTASFGDGVALQADGKILVAGTSGGNFAVARYNADGSLDTSFNGTGTANTNISGTDVATSLVVQSDGKIVVTGFSGSGVDFSLVRYNSDGTLDTTFSGDGKLTTNLGGSDHAWSMAVQPDGMILMAGSSGNNFALVRYDSSGNLDNTFGTGGIVTTDFDSVDEAYSLALQADGKILLAGISGTDVALARYNSNGTLDTSFDGDGKLTDDWSANGYSLDVAEGIAVQPDGKIVVGGYSSDDFGLARYNSDGSPDVDFNGDGRIKTDFGFADSAYAIAIEPDGDIVVVGGSGYYYGGIYGDFAMARYKPDGSLDPALGTPDTLNGTPVYTQGGPAVLMDGSVSIYDADLSALNNFNGASLVLSRHGGANTDDQFGATGNLSLSGGNALLSGTTIGSVSNGGGGMLIIAFNANATQARVNEALSSITYANGSGTPPASVQIDWTFKDGNGAGPLAGAQGSGGGLDVLGLITVEIRGAADHSVTLEEDQTHAFSAAELGLGGGVDNIQITSQPAQGVLAFHGGAIGAGATIPVIELGSLEFIPGTNGYGTNYASFNFLIGDGAGGFNAATHTAHLDVTAVNDAPQFSASPSTGWITKDFGSTNDRGLAVLVEGDGKIDVAGGGSSSNNFLLARYSSDGAYFDAANTNFGFTDVGKALAQQPDGMLLVAGQSGTNFGLARYTTVGGLDTSFGTLGKVTVDFGGTDSAQGVAVQGDGKIVLAGTSGSGIALARYTSSGILDTSFDTDGKVTTPIGASAGGQGVALQTLDGKIVVAGFSDNDFAVIRYNGNGDLDSGFASGGIAITDFFGGTDRGQAVAVQPDGKILVAGYASNGVDDDFALVRYNSNGTLDTTFSGDGRALVDFGGGTDRGFGLALQGDGKIVVAGVTNNGYTGYDFAVARLNDDGTLDTSFDGDGKRVTDIGASDGATSVAIDPDGNIVVAGSTGDYYNGAFGDFAVVRYTTNGAIDSGFGAISTLDEVPTEMVGDGFPVGLDGSVSVYDAELAALNNYNGAIVTLSRHGGANPEDMFVPGGNLVFNGANAELSGVVIGTVTNGVGTLSLTFNSNATQARVNEALSSLGYQNETAASDGTIQIDWTFSDGNNGGAQGAGGTLSVLGITTVNLDVPCFLRGTRILTRAGYVPVESLRPGDEVLTLKHGWRKLLWLGCRHIPRNERGGFDGQVQPIRIVRDAFGAGLPARDVWVSPDHAVFFRDHLIPAKCLVNGVTVIRDDDVDAITYYHVLLDRHAVVFSEGLPTESYTPQENLEQFENYDTCPEHWRRDVAVPIGLWADCHPRVSSGPTVETARAYLARRVAEAGEIRAVG